MTSKICLIFVLICISFKHVKLEPNGTILKALDFDQIKTDLFLKSEFRMFNPADLLNKNRDALICAKEIKEIQSGLESYQLWALKCKFAIYIVFIQFENVQIYFSD